MIFVLWSSYVVTLGRTKYIRFFRVSSCEFVDRVRQKDAIHEATRNNTKLQSSEYKAQRRVQSAKHKTQKSISNSFAAPALAQ
jgi:hypothetical protein